MSSSTPRSLVGITVWCLTLGTAQAAETATETLDELETVTVTGSRIASRNMNSSSPILAVSSEEIKAGGRLDVTDMLNLLPQINSNSLGEDLGNKTSGLTSAGGVSTVNLRGLGASRTLVLRDGRRLGAGSPQTVISAPTPNVDEIPGALIERVEVVTGGASAVYGSDAIAGVVNFIMKDDFEGLQFDGQFGGNWHNNNNGFARQRVTDAGYDVKTGSKWDGDTTNLSLTAGRNFFGGRGNITGYLSYSSMKPVRSADRDFGGCQLFYTGSLDDLECGGSSNANFFSPTNTTVNPDGNVYSVSGNSFVDWGSVDTVPPAVFNSQAYIYMQRDDERYHGGLTAHLDVNDHFRPYAEFSYMKDKTHQEVAPTALFRGANVLSDTGNYLINCSNPLLSTQQAALLCTPGEIAADALDPGSVSADVEIGRRNVEGGGRTYDFTHRNHRLVLGTRGDLAQGWTYDAYGQYYKVDFGSVNGKDITFDKIANALQVRSGTSGPECISGGDCVPYNIFTEGGVTPEALDYLVTLGTANGSTGLRTIHADATGDLGQYGMKLPWAAEGIAVNLGFEYRKESLKYVPDAATESGLIVGTGGAYPRIDESLSVRELSAEIRAPLASDLPGIHDLVADAGYRYSDYSVAGGVNTFKLGLQYAPVPSVRLRTSFNRAIRAPSITELFNPQLVGKIAFGEDPCAPSEDDGTLNATFEQCARTGVTQAQYDNRSIPQGTAGQLTQLQGGNPDLKPESADTFSIGLTVRPESLPGFTGSIDYYRIKAKGLVGALPANLILENCLNTGDPTFCSQLVRHPITGTLNGASVQSGGYIIQTNVNIGASKMDGIDIQAGYAFDLGGAGSLKLALNSAWMLSNTSTPIPGGGTYDCTGLFGPTCQTVNPEWRNTLSAAWSLPNDVTITGTLRNSSGVKLDHNDSDPDLYLSISDFDSPLVYRASMPAVTYVDLSSRWDINENFTVRAGINNLFDKDPPIAPSEIISGGAPNYYEYYDGLGRQVFLAVTAKF